MDGSQQSHGVMPARPPMGRDHGGIQALDRAFLILDVMADAGGEAKADRNRSDRGTERFDLSSPDLDPAQLGLRRPRPEQPQLRAGVAHSPPQRRLSAAGGFAASRAKFCRSPERPDQEAVQLAIMQDTNLVNILRREARHAVRVDAGFGGNANAAHAAATGKAILAWLPPSELDRIVADKGLTAFTPNTITDIEALKEELRLTRRRGFSIDREEFRPGVICLGAAIRDHAGAVVGSISVSSPAFRATQEYLDQIKVHLIAVTDELSAELGAPGAMLRGSIKSIAAE